MGRAQGETLNGWPRHHDNHLTHSLKRMAFSAQGFSPLFDPSWAQSVQALVDFPGVAMVVGAPDTGKTTWVAAAALCLAGRGLPVGIVDADIGQSTIGPPTTVALSLLEKPVREFSLDTLQFHALLFVGAISPIGHLLQMVVATKRMVEKALQAGMKAVLVDTTGLIDEGVGFQLKLRKIDLIAPAHLVMLQHEKELEGLMSVLKDRPGLRIYPLRASRFARFRSPADRSQHRTNRFASYFSKAETLVLDCSRLAILSPPPSRARMITERVRPLIRAEWLRAEEIKGLVVGLNNSANETLGLGLLEGFSEDMGGVRVLTPVHEASAIRILQVGSIRLSRAGQEL